VFSTSLDNLELDETRSKDDDSLRAPTAYPISWESGARGSAVVYFELEPGCHLGMHAHSAEEVVLVVSGAVDASVGDEERRLAAGSLALVPAATRHDVRCVGPEKARCVGFFPAAAVQTIYDQPLEPDGERMQGTPSPGSV
jgi:quercetin dioxygenase-like cupin family protein